MDIFNSIKYNIDIFFSSTTLLFHSQTQPRFGSDTHPSADFLYVTQENMKILFLFDPKRKEKSECNQVNTFK
jgi:hypothetical protein